MTAITERIVERMRDLGLEEIDLAAGVRVAQSTVNRWTHHLSDPRSSSVPALAATLDVSMAWLLTGEEQPYDDVTVLTVYGIIEPTERMAKRYLAKKRLTREEAQELRDALDGAAAARQMLGLEASSELDAEVARRLAELRAEREARREIAETAEPVPPEEEESHPADEEGAPDGG